MTDAWVDQECACKCGRSTFELRGRPLFRFLCHCRICQTLYGEPYADATVFRAKAVTLPDGHPVEFNRYRSPPSLRRGICSSCHAPVVGFMGMAFLLELAFVPSRNCSLPEQLPPPSVHIFYDRRAQDVDDALPKITGYWRSEYAVTKMILKNLSRAASDDGAEASKSR